MLKLDRGFERVLTVLEDGTETPIEGVDAFSEFWVLLGTTDAQGTVALQSEVVPTVIWMRAPGYDQAAWQPNNTDARVKLVRTRTR